MYTRDARSFFHARYKIAFKSDIDPFPQTLHYHIESKGLQGRLNNWGFGHFPIKPYIVICCGKARANA